MRLTWAASVRTCQNPSVGSWMAVVVGIKDRKSNQVVAKVVKTTDKESLQGFVSNHVNVGSTVYTDEHRSYQNMAGFKHEVVKLSVSEYVLGSRPRHTPTGLNLSGRY